MAARIPCNLSISRPRLAVLCPAILWSGAFALYAATAAPGTLFGDPSEYQFIPAILGIAHPPGYALYTLMARLWQMIVPVGTIAFRTNLLAAAVGAWAVVAVYLNVYILGMALGRPQPVVLLGALFGGASWAVATDLWQHATHANPHVVSAALALTHLALLFAWWYTDQDRWLYGFAVTIGLAATHHPITLMGVPAYGVFILIHRPGIWRQRRVLLTAVGCALLGLLPLLYYPLRSPSAPFGPTDMHTWSGFWRHFTAQGLRVNLFHFGLADQFDRMRVFVSLLRLQFPLPTIACMLLGMAWLARRAAKATLLPGLFLLTHLAFTLNTVQDVMAYLLLPMGAFAILGGVGLLALGGGIDGKREEQASKGGRRQWQFEALFLLCVGLPLYQGGLNIGRGISLRDFTAADDYVAAVYERFAGRGEGAILLSDWEHLTPLWTHIYTQGHPLNEEDVKLVFVSTATTWPQAVWDHIAEGPVYLPAERPAVRNAGFRLVPDGRSSPFYRVVAPPVTDEHLPPYHPLDIWADGRVHLVGFDAPTTAHSGEPLRLLLYQQVTEPLEGIWMPWAQFGPLEARWTTDSRLLTPQWQPGEIVPEVYELPIPFDLTGRYELRLGYADLSGGRPALALSTGETLVGLTTVTVEPGSSGEHPPTVPEHALADLDHQVALVRASVLAGRQRRYARWEEPVAVPAGQALHLTLRWQALASPRESLTVFIHLIDGNGRPVLSHDYTPLGGSAPTYLWFPKWLPGQTFTDPYRLIVPAELPGGDYWLEVGMYGMTSLRRLPVVDLAGNLAGDRVILGPVRVTGK